MLVKTLVAFSGHKAGAEVEYAKTDAERLARAGKVEFMTAAHAPPPQKRKTRKRKKKHLS